MNAQTTITKGQRVEFRTGSTQMVNGEFVRDERIAQGVVIGFFKARRYVRVLEDGKAQGDSGLVSWNDIVSVAAC